MTKKMPEPQYALADLGDRRVLAVGGREYATVYSTRVIQMLISFSHMTEYLAEQPEVAAVTTFDTDATFVAIVRAKVAELGLRRVHEVAHFEPVAVSYVPTN